MAWRTEDRGVGPGQDGRARSSGHRSGANLGAGVQLNPGAARNGGSHLASLRPLHRDVPRPPNPGPA
ncbi:Hypothetical predicted protein [Marmota monax]|uniref:Uncharacterized protein n=1 Tax=Marmota monax TaxID=9995 RepID=A0A5E4A7I0_MARMO|nr:Hypothetical predicted protein [Marmota monax]